MSKSTNDLNPAERATIDMLNIFRAKEVYGIVIQGSTQNGYYTEMISPPIQLNPNATHRIYLQSFSSFQNIDNIFIGVNDLFRYTNNSNVTKDIVLPPGAYQLKDMYSYIQSQMVVNGDYNISASTSSSISYYVTFNTFLPTQQIQITLSNNYKVDFSPANSIASILGFNNSLLTGNTMFSSTNLADILPTQGVNINCNIANGFRLKGQPSNILYSFNNSTPRGSMIDITPNPVVPCIVNNKTISQITIWFNDDKYKPINFKGENFIVRVMIEQM